MANRPTQLSPYDGPFQILVTTDLSSDAETGVKRASEEAKMRGTERCTVTLLTIVENPLSAAFDLSLGADRENVWLEAETEARRKLTHLTDRYFRSIINNCTVIRESASVADEITRFAKTHGTDLIVIATHGRTGIARTLFGSVAEKVVRHTPCPLLIVPIEKS